MTVCWGLPDQARTWPRSRSNGRMGRTRAYTRILPFMSSIMLNTFLRVMHSSCAAPRCTSGV